MSDGDDTEVELLRAEVEELRSRLGEGSPSGQAEEERPVRSVPSWEGWKEVARALGVCEDTAQEYASRAYLPLVVFVDHAGRIWTPKSNVAAFVNLQHLPLWAHRALKRNGLLPQQQSSSPKVPRRRRRRGGRTKRRSTK